MPTRELIHVPLQVLWAKSVKRTHVRSFQHSPERFNPVRMRLAFDVLGYRMFDRIMFPWDTPVS